MMRPFFGAVIMIFAASACFVRDSVMPYIVLYPEKGKQMVRFNYFAPSAREVYLAGDFNQWTVPRYEGEVYYEAEEAAIPMRREGDYWVTEVLIRHGVHYYKYYVDGMYWKIDERSHEKVQTLSGEWKNIVTVQ